MNFDFLTPEVFDMLVIANLIVGLLLMAFRFYQDVQYAKVDPVQRREQVHDESSHAAAQTTRVSDDKSPANDDQ